MSKKALTITQFFKLYPDEETCLEHLFNTRFGQGSVCSKCRRSSKWHRIKAERAYSCQWCGHHIHPTVGTPFEQTRTPLQYWFYAIYLFTTTRHGVPAKELQRQLGVTYKTAWRMGHEIRKHMAAVDGDEPIGGAGEIVEIDETFVGGRFARGHRGGDPAEGKSIVFGMLERGGQIATQVVPDRTQDTVFPLVRGGVAPRTEIHTDKYRTYRTVGNMPGMGYTHKSVNHSAGEYVSPQGASVNAIENYWSQLKRAIKGTHVSVSGKHLEKYAKEFQFRFNRRGRPEMMFPELLTSFSSSS